VARFILLSIAVFFLFLGGRATTREATLMLMPWTFWSQFLKGWIHCTNHLKLFTNGNYFLNERLMVIVVRLMLVALIHLLKKFRLLNTGNIDAASAECDKQKGSVANVIKSGFEGNIAKRRRA